jgi:hypothetical protein
VVWERVAGHAVPEGFHVHHMGPKTCWCPHQLVAIQACLHPAPEPLRDPYTGQFLKAEAYERRYGTPPPRS